MLKFPSPVGELHFSIALLSAFAASIRVSVPCRGTTFLNRIYRNARNKVQVSVPCRGTTFLNKVLYMKILYRQSSFRPLSGNYISQFFFVLHSSLITKFPSPVGELHFSMD